MEGMDTSTAATSSRSWMPVVPEGKDGMDSDWKTNRRLAMPRMAEAGQTPKHMQFCSKCKRNVNVNHLLAISI